jgi:hypothetical protein
VSGYRQLVLMQTGELRTTLQAAVIAQFVMDTALLLRIGPCDQRVMRTTGLWGFLPCCLDGERSSLATMLIIQRSCRGCRFPCAASARSYCERLRSMISWASPAIPPQC